MRKKFTFLTAALALLACLAIPLQGEAQTTVTYSQTSTSAVNVSSGTAPSGSSASFSTTYTNMNQLTSGNSMTLTLSGYAGQKITGITLSMKSNSSKGAGTLSVTAGSTTLASINPAAAFNTSSWYNAWSTSYVDVNIAMINDSYAIQANEDVEITIAATQNSLYCQSFTLTYEEAGSTSTAVATTVTIDPSGITNTDLAEGNAAGSLTATVTETASGNAVTGASVTWVGDNNNVATIDASTGAVTLAGVGTVTFTASYAGVEDEYLPNSASYEMTVTNSHYQVSTLEFTAACGGSGTADDGAEWTVTSDGTESNFDNTCGIHYGTNKAEVTYVQLATSDIIGTVSTVVVNARDAQETATITVTVGGVAFTCTGSATATNTSADYTFTGSGSGEIVVRIDRGTSMTKAIYVKKVVVTYEPSNDPAITLSTYEVNVDADAHNGTITATYSNMPDAVSYRVQFYQENGEDVASYDWITATINSDNVAYQINANEGVARHAYFKVYAQDNESGDDVACSNLVVVNQDAPVVNYATLPFEWAGGTSADLNALNGVTVVSDSDYASQNAPYRVKFKNNDHYILIKTDEQPGMVSVDIKKIGGDGISTITIQGSSNGTDFVDVQTFSNVGDLNTALTHTTTNAFAATDRYVKICFTKVSTNGTNIGVGPITVTKVVDPVTTSKTVNASTWYFIASPTGTAPTNINALGDLYYYDEQDHMWRNKKVNANGFDFYYGKGYLCANENADVTLSFTGNLFTGDTYNVPVSYNEYTSDEVENSLAGWNLVGNPFNISAYIGQSYFVIGQEEGQWKVVAGNGAIAPYAGVMVQTLENTNITFSKNPSKSEGSVTLALLRKEMTRGAASSSLVDNAIVSFDEGSQLEKLVFNNELSKLYIPQNGKDYAVVSAEAQGEMPVNFKASTDGEYTITVNPEGVELNYLHLIDNMTGMDVNLLQTPSYTFDATTRDYESRFRLVFAGASTSSATDETFAYYDGSEWQVSNEGEATLQVVDVMGRIVSTETVNGNFNLNLNQTAGVYMLRLINSNGVKTQKIVVR